MNGKKNILVTALATFCLTCMLLTLTPIQGVGPYDPWADIKPDVPDGTIDIKDVSYVAKLFGAEDSMIPSRPVELTRYNSSSLTYDRNIPANSAGNLNVTTDGYSQVTISFSAADQLLPVDVSTGFQVGRDYVGTEFFQATGAPTVAPHWPNALWMEPPTVDITGRTAGYKFNITVYTNVTADAYAWQTKLLFNSTYLNAVRAGYGDFFAGYYVVPVTPIINNVSGTFLYGTSLTGYNTKTGYGSLYWVEFELMSPAANTEIRFSEPYGSSTYLTDYDYNVIVPMTMYNLQVGLYPGAKANIAKVYPIIGPTLRIDYMNRFDFNNTLHIEVYLTTAGPSTVNSQTGSVNWPSQQNVNVTNWPTNEIEYGVGNCLTYNLTWNGTNYGSFSTNAIPTCGFSKLFLQVTVTGCSRQEYWNGNTSFLHLILTSWFDLSSGYQFSEWQPSDVLNETMEDGYGTPRIGSQKIDVKGPMLWAWFQFEDLLDIAPSGWITLEVYYYTRNE